MPVVQVALLVLLLLPSAKVVASAVATASSGRENLRSGVRTMREGSSFTIYGKAGEQRARTASGASSRHHIQAPGSEKAGSHSARGDGTETLLSFACSNEYPAVTHTKWKHLAEPFRETTLSASSKIGDSDATKDLFVWRFEDEASTTLEGREVTHTFKSVGLQRVRISQTVVATGKTYHLEAQVMVKYVRREIRQLNHEDREAFFNAVETIYRVPTLEGNAVYGNDYKGIEYFVQMHLDGAGREECDHWHDDAGIMTHHAGFTLLFEQGLQVVNPAVSVPYWSYTIESASGYDTYGESEIFSDDWFGDASPSNALHTVDRGRFAYLPVLKNAADYGYIHNAYGLLRTPWNLDFTPFVTRHNATNGQAKTDMVTCDLYSTSFESVTLREINNYLNGGTHGPVHIILGGEWDNFEEAFIQASDYAQLTILISKFLWRKGYMRLPEACSSGDGDSGGGDASACRASCPAELYESRGMTPYDVLLDTHAMYWVADLGSVVRYKPDEDRFVVMGHEDDEEFQTAFWAKMLRSLCDPGHVGEMFTSAAPYDPIFWVIHPEAERFLNWRRMLGRKGVEGYDFDETWGYWHHPGVAGDTGTVCDWSAVRPGTLDMPSCFKKTCGGHNADDVLPFEVRIKGEVRKMTNVEWLEFIYPETEDLPYLYNEYNWNHCEAAGSPVGPSSNDEGV
ncbi:unnamed protein product [Ascophyllum nodosum]